MGNYGVSTANSTDEEAAFASTNPPPPGGTMSPIAKMEDQILGINNPDIGNYVTGLDPLASWDDSAVMPVNSTGLERLRSLDDTKPFSALNASDNQVLYAYLFLNQMWLVFSISFRSNLIYFHQKKKRSNLIYSSIFSFCWVRMWKVELGLQHLWLTT